MKMLNSFLLMGFLLSFMPVCAQETTPIIIKFEKSDLEVDEAKLSEVADEISYIKLETNPDVIIGSASRYYVKQIPKGFMIWNSRGAGKIMMFDPEGKFIGFVGNEGKGPGEYYGYYKVLYDRYLDNVLVLLSDKVLRYDMDGEFLSSVVVETNDSRIERMCVKDDQTWLFTYKKPYKDVLFEVGVLATNKNGKLLKQYNLTDKKNPGSYGFQTQMNYVYQRGNDSYYTPFNYYQTFKLSKADQWEPYVKIKSPFEKVPIEIYKANDIRKLNETQQKYGQILSAFVYGDHLMIWGATPKTFTLMVDINSMMKLKYSYSIEFKKFGVSNDIDGGLPFFLRGYNSEGISFEMIDAQDLLDYAEKGLLNPDGKNYGPHKNLAEVLEATKPEDNPIIMVVHVK